LDFAIVMMGTLDFIVGAFVFLQSTASVSKTGIELTLPFSIAGKSAESLIDLFQKDGSMSSIFKARV